jgi:hypothetical protein
MRTPGVEPGPQAWEACMMPLHYVRDADGNGKKAMASWTMPECELIQSSLFSLRGWQIIG